MAEQGLGPNQRAVLDCASPAAIEDAAARLRGYLAKERWLGNNNRYLRRAVDNVKQDAKAPQHASHKHLAEYIAASAALHCADGWAYLGRALNANTSGDASIARHLAYYAELRAALALLATQGVGIFSSQNAVIDASGQAQFFGGPTHVTTWQALEHWADGPNGAARLASVIRPAGVSLSEWTKELGLGTGAWSPVGRQWLRAWGLDLRMFGNDRDTRNQASYRPTALRETLPDSVQDAEYVRDFWPLFEPAPSDPFARLDRHLLRLSSERAFEAITGQTPEGNAGYRRALERSLRANAGLELDSTLGRFLTRIDDSMTPPLFEAAQTRASHLHPRYHVHAMSRAALLLRVATGACAELLQRAQVSVTEYRFWLERTSEAHGICGPDEFPDDPGDLWIDVDEALATFGDLVDRGSDLSFAALGKAGASELNILSGCTRLAVWGLAA